VQIVDLLVKEVYILIPVLYVIGVFLKKIPKLADWLIPWILLGLGMIGGFFLAGMNVHGILQGILAAGASVFTNQLYKQTKAGIASGKNGGGGGENGRGGALG